MNPTPSPFKFLEPFTFADRKNFFGRGKEVETLYRVVQRTPLLLLYGLSGTGKTSLVQCGLAARFDGPDWLPLWIRREDDFVRSLHKEIDGAFTTPAPAGAGAPEKIQALYRQYLRPVFLMFDQFEELFILGDTAERNAFVGEIKSILKAGLPCTILLIIREEYLGRLYPLEKDIPNLFDFRMRVEPMDTANVTKVLTDSFANFNISLEAPADKRIGEIIENIRLKDSPVELPHLQVYLDRLYREDYVRTYPNGADSPEDTWPPLEFTKAEIADFGTIENVLDEFLLEQRGLIQVQFENTFPGESGTQYAVDRVLAAFVSAEGTKRPISVTEEAGGLVIAPRQRALFPALSPAALSWCIKQLAQSRILHSSGASYELTHDTLATAVERQQNAEQKQLSEARRRIELGYKDHLDTNGQSFIDQAMLFRLEPHLPKLDLPKEWEEFVDNSYKEVKRQADAEKERVERELRLAEEKLVAERKQQAAEQEQQAERLRLTEEMLAKEAQARKRQRFFTRLVAGVAVLAIGASVFAFFKQKQATEASSLAETRRLESEENLKLANKNEQTANKAKAEAEQNLALAKKNEEKARDALAQADQNLILAKKEEAKAKSALEQVQKEKAATEAQRKIAEDNYRIAQQKTVEAETSAKVALDKTKEAERERDRAETARLEAEGNLKKFEAASAEIVDALVREADNLIYHLDYAGATAKLRTAADLNQPTASFQKALAEVAFFWNEGGQTTQVADLLAVAKQTDAPKEKAGLQSWLKKYAGPWHDSLILRYYPNMLPVAGGEANIDDKKAAVGAFKMARTETTMWQYALFYTSQGNDMRANKDLSSLSWGINGDNPVVYVSWFDAALYANWLSRRFGLREAYKMGEVSKGDYGDYYKNIALDSSSNGYRLPTEVEWEYAARGGAAQENFRYPGNNEIDSVGWYSGNSGNRTRPVATKQANNLGLYDMSGNAWERCGDWHGEYPATFPANYRGQETGSGRVLRGGGWRGSAEGCLPAYRSGSSPDYRTFYCGFRLALIP